MSVTAIVAKSSTIEIPAILMEFVQNAKSFLVSEALRKIVKGKAEELRKEDIENLKTDIEKISKNLERLSKQNIEFDKRISEFVSQLIESDGFNKSIEGNSNLKSQIGKLKVEVLMKLEKIYEEITILTAINLPKIESLLEKGIDKEPEFFRNAGPIWTDFDNDFVYKSPEVNKVIKELENEDLIVIKGKPASGKSVILRNIGYELAKRNADIYYIELKKFLQSFTNEISKISHGYIIVDDAHLNIDLVEYLIVNRPRAKVIIASRDIDIERIKGLEYKFTEFLEKGILVEAENLARGLVDHYEKSRGKIPSGIKRKLSESNLWMLAWQLIAYAEYKSVDHEKVFEAVRKHIEQIKNVYGPGSIRNPENALLPLAIFYRHEIPVRKPFIEEFADDETVEKLLALSEISMFSLEGKDYLSLHHSEVAEIYLKVFLYFTDFGKDVKNRIDKCYEEKFGNVKLVSKLWVLKPISIYLRKYPEETTNILPKVWHVSGNYCWMYLRGIISRNFDDIVLGLNTERYISKIDWSLNLLDRDLKDKLIELLDPQELIRKVNSENDIEKIANLLMEINDCDTFRERVSEYINPKVLFEKIKEDDNIKSVLWFLYSLANTLENSNLRIPKTVWKKMKIYKLEDLVKRVLSQEDINDISLLLLYVFSLDKSKAFSILNTSTFREFFENLMRNGDISDIRDFLLAIDPKLLNKIVSQVGVDAFVNRIIESLTERKLFKGFGFYLGDMADLFHSISNANMTVLKRILRNLDADLLTNDLNEEESSWVIASFISAVSIANRDLSISILRNISKTSFNEFTNKIKAEGEEGFSTIQWCISELAEASEVFARKVVKNIGKNWFLKVILQEEDLEKVVDLIRTLYGIDGKFAYEVLNTLDSERRNYVIEALED